MNKLASCKTQGIHKISDPLMIFSTANIIKYHWSRLYNSQQVQTTNAHFHLFLK